MSESSDPKSALLRRISEKRSEIDAFLSKAQPRNKRLVNISIICSAVAAAMTAGPAFGGQGLTAWLSDSLGLTSPVWQLLCLGATACSVAATIATNMAKSHEVASRVLRAQTSDAKLEGLETLVEMDQIELGKASTLYAEYLPEIPFI